MVILTGGMVVLTLALALVTYLSLRVIRGQLSEMKSAGQQTDKMIEIARKQAEAAGKSADAATSAANSGKEALRLSERAWVGVISAHIDPMVANTRAHGSILMQNSSRGTAIHVHVRANSGLYEGPLPTNPPYRAQNVLQSDRMLMPGNKFEYEFFSPAPLSANEVARSSDAGLKWRYYVWAKVTYVDVFGDTHTTKFCGLYDPRGNGSLITCPFYNEPD